MTNMKKFKLLLKDNSGQALLLVIVSLTVALAVVTSISLRNISTTSRITQTDTSYRVNAAAEGGAERFMALSRTQLTNLVPGATATSGPNSTNCSNAGVLYSSTEGKCYVSFPRSGNDNIDTNAYVAVLPYPNSSTFDVTVNNGEVYELALSSYSANNINIMWRPQSGTVQPALYMLGYTGTMSGTKTWKAIYCPNGGCTNSIMTPAPNFNPSYTSNAGSGGYSNLISNLSTQITGTNMYALRIIPLGAAVDIRVTAPGGTRIPDQGYLIESTGELANNSGVSATKIQRVFKSNSFLPAMFNFGIYSGGVLFN